MKKVKTVAAVLLALAVIASPFVTVAGFLVFSEPQYEKTFLGELDDKLERLTSATGEKLVVVGGSSVAFGLKSEILEKYTGRTVVNFGLYAALGTKLMLDLSRAGISEGDVVVIAPELDAQTLSLYFNADATLRALDGELGMLRYVGVDNFFSALGASWGIAAEKLRYIRAGESPSTEGVYSADSFNEYGDVAYPREENIMPLYYDPNTAISLNPAIVSQEFIDYVNEYIEFCEARGARVLFSWCPMNSLAVVGGEEEALAFEEYMKGAINCTFISDIRDYVLEPEYFYDTNFHTNDYGAIRRTVTLTEDVLLELGIPRLVEMPAEADAAFDGADLVTVSKPELPLLDVKYFDTDENDKYFVYEQSENGSYTIVGLSELGKTQKSLTLPLGAEHFIVGSVARGAFAGGCLEELVVPEGTKISVFMSGAFEGAGSLSRLVMLHPHAADILPPADFVGTASDFKVLIPKGSDYEFDYYWSERGLTFEVYQEAQAY